MKKIMFLMAAAMITVGGLTAQAQVKPVAKTEQSKPAEKKAGKTTHHAAKKHAAKKDAAATAKQK